jgi:hypothetical protein
MLSLITDANYYGANILKKSFTGPVEGHCIMSIFTGLN